MALLAEGRRQSVASRQQTWSTPRFLFTTPLFTTASVLVAAATFVPMASAHDHHDDDIPEGLTVSAEPLDPTLWAHIFVQMLAFGILFPIGMVLGIIKSRWHVPLQVLATIIAMLGWALGHLHGGRKFAESNVHAHFSTFIFFQLLTQIVLGIYLKLHLERGIHGRIRPVFKLLHNINGKAFPIVSWTQMLFGGITALGFCQGDHLGQCLAHFIMGSAFIAYGIILTILLLVGQLWLRRTGRSQEFFDSVVIAAWGLVNSLTEHRWGTEWVRNDWQHTTMGIIWFAAGLAGVWLSRDREGNPKRNFIPGFVLLMTGWAMSAHPQELMISAMTHKMFGYTLMGAGLTRMIEISFVLQDKPGVDETGFGTHSFQYVPVFLLFASGFLFMGATEEQMALIAWSGMDAVAYVLILYSLAFLLFLFVMMLINVYDRSANPITAQKGLSNGHAVGEEEGRLRDAGEFELEGLMTDDEEDEENAARRKLLDGDGFVANGHGNGNGNGNGNGFGNGYDEGALATPSTTATVGRNNERLA